LLSKYGAGLMIGAALIIIIPEGIMVIISSYIDVPKSQSTIPEEEHDHDHDHA
jgi:hypothetical protein